MKIGENRPEARDAKLLSTVSNREMKTAKSGMEKARLKKTPRKRFDKERKTV